MPASLPAAPEGAAPFEPGRVLPAQSLSLYFDYTCPFAYLGSIAARALAARMGVTLTYRPILLGGIFRAQGTPQNLSGGLGPAKAAHNAADMQRWARRIGATLRMPAEHPMRSVEALRATLVTALDPAVIDGFYRAYWVDNRPISSPEVISDVVTRAGHDASRVLDAIGSADVKEDLKKRTEEAVARGVFGVPTWVVDDEHLYWGQDRLTFVRGVRPDAQATAGARGGAASASPPTLEVYWDFSSPFAYLGSAQIAGLAARTGANVVWHPLLLGGLFREIGMPDVPLASFPEAKQRYTMKDLDRWAAYWGVPFRFPSRFPMRSLDALRFYLALPESRRAPFRDAVFRAYWAEDRDIADRAVLAACVGDETIAREALAKAGSDEVKAELRASTERAAARGVFGVPTFVVRRSGREEELFWGQDRIELVEDALSS
jgi:2-hydroxychromene-2-carboxylate isomerase